MAEIVETLDLNKEGPMVSQQFFHVWKDFKTNILKAVCRHFYFKNEVVVTVIVS